MTYQFFPRTRSTTQHPRTCVAWGSRQWSSTEASSHPDSSSASASTGIGVKIRDLYMVAARVTTGDVSHRGSAVTGRNGLPNTSKTRGTSSRWAAASPGGELCAGNALALAASPIALVTSFSPSSHAEATAADAYTPADRPQLVYAAAPPAAAPRTRRNSLADTRPSAYPSAAVIAPTAGRFR